jgi:hypothetical protein
MVKGVKPHKSKQKRKINLINKKDGYMSSKECEERTITYIQPQAMEI